MKLSKMKQLVAWAEVQPEEFQKKLQKTSTCELLMLSGIPLSKAQQIEVIRSFMRHLKFTPTTMAHSVAMYASEHDIDFEKFTSSEITIMWIKFMCVPPKGILTAEQLKNK